MSKILRLIKRDFMSLLGEKTYVSIVILQLLLFATSRSFTAGIILISEPSYATEAFRLENVVGFGFLRNDSLSQRLSNQSNLLYLPSLEIGLQYLNNNTLDLVVSSPENLDALAGGTGKISFDAYSRSGNPKNTLSLFVLKGLMEGFEKDVKFSRIHESNPILVLSEEGFSPSTKEIEVLYSFTIPLLLLFSSVISGSFVIDLVTEEIEKKTYASLLSAPVSAAQILLSKALLPAIVAGMQAIFWLAIFLLQGIIISNIIILVAFLFCMSVVFGSIGLLVSGMAKSNKGAQMAYTIAMLFSLFFLTMNSSRFMPAFVITSLAMSPAIDWAVLAVWAGLSAFLLSVSLLVSSKRLGQIT